ncbi:hypothetical protein SAMN06298216_2775 [Spirosomataceae bacterium TFI 002]|nr:hypothetical protein SAMN06298216_2775 [Spirosomataceae bacterium TFI 002]
MASAGNNFEIPSWLMIVIFVGILAVLAIFGDLFTFILGALLEILVFSIGYNKKHLGEH